MVWFCVAHESEDQLADYHTVTPILGAIIADQYLGKYNTILVFAAVYWVGLLVLWTTALPASIEGGHALGGYIAAIIIIGFGTGGIKSNIAPLIADQYQRRTMAIKVQKGGERTIIDPAITYQRIYMVFYWVSQAKLHRANFPCILTSETVHQPWLLVFDRDSLYGKVQGLLDCVPPRFRHVQPRNPRLDPQTQILRRSSASGPDHHRCVQGYWHDDQGSQYQRTETDLARRERQQQASPMERSLHRRTPACAESLQSLHFL
jgi:hypothetical protein